MTTANLPALLRLPAGVAAVRCPRTVMRTVPAAVAVVMAGTVVTVTAVMPAAVMVRVLIVAGVP